MRKILLWFSVAAFVLLPLHALGHHGKEFLVTPTYKTPEQGSYFLILSSQYENSEHHGDAYEFEPGFLYGVTNRWSLEIHTHHALSSGDFHTESVAFETRLRLFGPGELHMHEGSHRKTAPFSLAALLEYEKGLGDEHNAVEGRLIAGREFGTVMLSANVIAGKILDEEEDVEYLYAIGVKKSVSSSIGVGLELDGGFQSGDGISLTPGIYGTVAQGLDLRVGPSVGFGNRSGDFQLRATILYGL